MSGVNFKENFDVPVRRATDGLATIAPQRADAFAPARGSVSPMDLAAAGIHITPTAEGTKYYFAAQRNPSFAMGVTVFTLIWTGALALQYALEFPRIFVVATGLVELLLLLIVADLWCGSITVTIGVGTVRRRHGLFGFGGTRVIPCQNIKSLDLHIGMQSSGRSGIPYYDLRAQFHAGKHKHLGDGIRNKRHAEWLIERMRQEIGLGARAA